MPVFLGCLDAGRVAAAGKHDQLGSGGGGGDRLSLRGAADEVELAGHDEGGAGDAAQQWAQVNRLVQAAFPGLARRQIRFQDRSQLVQPRRYLERIKRPGGESDILWPDMARQ